MLTKAILEEIPTQVIQFAKINDLVPPIKKTNILLDEEKNKK